MLAVEAAVHVLALPYCDFSVREKFARSNKKNRKGNEARKFTGTLNEKIKTPLGIHDVTASGRVESSYLFKVCICAVIYCTCCCYLS